MLKTNIRTFDFFGKEFLESKARYDGWLPWKKKSERVIELPATWVKENILSKVNLANYFAMILDCTPNVNHVEDISMIVQFVDITQLWKYESSKQNVMIKEYFLVPFAGTFLRDCSIAGTFFKRNTFRKASVYGFTYRYCLVMVMTMGVIWKGWTV